MQLSVKTKARKCHDILSVMIRTTRSATAFVDAAEEYIKNIDLDVQERIKTNKAWCVGFVETFSHFATALQAGQIPDETAIKSAAPDDAPRLQSDTVCAIGSIIFEMAMNADRLQALDREH
jgi:hypothetical protein